MTDGSPTEGSPDDEAGDLTVYEFVGGTPFFVELVDRFYDGVMADPLLAHMYPPEDLAGAKARLTGFLVQYWGGPTTYSDERGHPRLRMRHAPFVIGPAERDAWFTHMSAAVRAAGLHPVVEEQLLGYFEMAASAMINTR